MGRHRLAGAQLPEYGLTCRIVAQESERFIILHAEASEQAGDAVAALHVILVDEKLTVLLRCQFDRRGKLFDNGLLRNRSFNGRRSGAESGDHAEHRDTGHPD